MSQNPEVLDSLKSDVPSDINVSFVKAKVHQSSDSLYFNVVKIENTTGSDISGELSLFVPSNFQLISPNNISQTVPANQSIYVPIRSSIPIDVEGDKSYLVVADYKYAGKVSTANSYISVPGNRKWSMHVEQKRFYVSEYNDIADLKINLQNKGNTTEMVKINLEVGRFLDLLYFNDDQDFIYIELPPHADTVIRYPVKYVGNQNDNYNRNSWKESAISVKGSNKIYERTDHVFFNEIESEYINQKDQRATPLNMELQVNNLLSGSPARYNLSAFGTVLFPEDREISYHVTGRNFLFTPYSEQNLSLENNAYYNVRYNDKNKFLEIGSQIGNSSLHSVYGRGLRGEYKYNDENLFKFSLTQGRFRPDYAGSVSYYRKLKRSLTVNAGITVEDNNTINYDAYSFTIGSSYSFLKYHSVGLQLILTQTQFENINTNPILAARDTANFGFSYHAFYAFRYKDLSFRVSNTNTLFNYISNSNNNRLNAYGNYKINDKLNANFIYDRSKILSVRYPRRFTDDASHNISDVGRLTFGYALNRNIYFMAGPIYNGIYQKTYNQTLGYENDYKNVYTALYLSTRFRLKNNQSITPNVSLGLSNASYSTTDPLFPEAIEKKNVKSLRAGLSYYSKMVRLNVFYNNGLASVSQQQLLFDGDWINSESIQIRPQIEKYFRNKTIRASSYVNYIYRMPSGRESINFNLSLNFYLKRGWSFYASNNLYTTTRDDEEIGRITNRVFNIFVGIRKSFDIPQPRMKYYDYDFVFYHDVNGNQEMNENERVIPNMMVKLQRDQDIEQTRSNFVEANLVSDPNGVISYKNLPEGYYKTSLTPLDNLEDLYVLGGNDQKIEVNSDTVHYIPLTESYKVLGQVKLNRDVNSNEGKVDVSNIRITAQSENGNTYAVLTDSRGGFILSIPQAGHYKVFVNNVLGDNFVLEKEEYIVDFNGIKRIVVDFVFNEKKRGINFGNNDLYDFKSLKEGTEEEPVEESDQ